jgi:hypothetical protein
VSTSDVQEIQKKYLTTPVSPIITDVIGRGGTMRMQGLVVKARRATVHQCKAKLTTEGHTGGFFLWATEDRPQGSQRTNLVPEEDDILIVWKAFKTIEKEELIINTEEQIPFDLQKFPDKTLDLEITFLSEDWKKPKPHKFKLNLEPWDEIHLEKVERTRFAFLQKIRS